MAVSHRVTEANEKGRIYQRTEPEATRVTKKFPLLLDINIPTFWPARDNVCYGCMTTVYYLPISTSPKKTFTPFISHSVLDELGGNKFII